MNRKIDRRFWWRHALLPLLLLAVGVAVFEFTDLDLHFSDPFYDASLAKPHVEIFVHSLFLSPAV